ncbi:response regulator [Lacunimicrobium album]
MSVTENVKLLMVDDLDENLLALEAVLRRDGLQLLKARSGAQALELLLQHEVALAIIDVQMPEMDGFELAEYMRGTERTRRVPIIFLTAGAHDEYRQFRGYETGAVDFMFKPFDAHILYSKTEVFVELFRQRQEIARQRDTILEREERLKLALRAGQTGVWEWNFQTGAILWSEETYAIFGHAPLTFGGTLDSFTKLIHPDDLDAVLQALHAARMGHDNFAVEYRIIRPDQQVRQVTNLAVLRRDAQGKPASMVGTVTDVTEQRRAQAALRQREVEFRTLSDNSPNIIARFDRRLRHVFVNKTIEAVSGMPASQYLGKTNRDLGMPVELCDQWDAMLNEVFTTLEPRVTDFALDIKGEPHRFHSHCVPERNVDGQVEHVLCVTRDVTPEWLATEQMAEAKSLAEAANAAKDQFLAVLSHELRTPLSPVRLVLSEWELDANVPESMSEGVEIIRRNIDLECRLIDDLLDVNRIAKGKVQLRLTPLNLHEEIGHALQIVDLDARAKKVHLVQKLNAKHVTSTGDAARIQQILWNLLSNAIKFTSNDGVITIHSENPDENSIQIEVSDNGIGIDSTKIDSIFNAFEQGGTQVTRQFGGLGLGLAISRTLAEMHEGTLTVTSQGLGTGATFRLVLPLTATPVLDKTPLPPTHQTSASTNDEPASGPLSILLVEDHEVSAKLMVRLLQSAGHTVQTAATVKTGIEAWEAGTFDLLISDLGLPDGSGYDLLAQIRSQGDVRAIALTGFGMQDEVERSIEAGFLAHVTKPVQFNEFLKLIHDHALKV